MKRRRRIVFFNRSYYPDFGATGQLLTELAEDLVARFEWDVTVVAGMPLAAEELIAPMHWYAPVRREARHGVRILRAWGTARPNRTLSGRILNYVSYFASASAAILRLGRQDVVVSLTDPPIVALTAMAAATLTGARFVFLCQDVFPEVIRLLEGPQNPRIEQLLAAISRRTVSRADRIIALGETMKRRLVETKHADPDKIVVIHNWADTSAIVPTSKQNPWAIEHGLADKFVLMHSGNVGMSQELDALLDVAERLRDLPDLVVAIVGEGSRKKALQEDAAKRGLTHVRFFPYTPKARLDESFATADIFAVSLKQGLAGFIVPSKLYGILAAGRPFIAAVEDDCETAQIAREHDCGIIVPPGDRERMAHAIRQLYVDRAACQRLAVNARAAGLIYDRPRAVEAYNAVLSGVLS
ncbi:MAG: glycosyltransferase family 4 protein [Acidobacteriaceae bacterium]|nr:glycosyltransferase family 4 protein [Acidobacteriaceae bacterium]